MRIWREDSFQQRLYDSALFWAEKIIHCTADLGTRLGVCLRFTRRVDQDPMDIYWMALTLYHQSEYLKCFELLRSFSLATASVWANYLASQCCVHIFRIYGNLTSKRLKWKTGMEQCLFLVNRN